MISRPQAVGLSTRELLAHSMKDRLRRLGPVPASEKNTFSTHCVQDSAQLPCRYVLLSQDNWPNWAYVNEEKRDINLDQLTEFFKWMTIINIGLLVLSSVLIMILKNVKCKMHGKLFGIKQEGVVVVAYGYLEMYRVLVIVFNIVPYISLFI